MPQRMTATDASSDHAAILAGIPQPYLVLDADLTIVGRDELLSENTRTGRARTSSAGTSSKRFPRTPKRLEPSNRVPWRCRSVTS